MNDGPKIGIVMNTNASSMRALTGDDSPAEIVVPVNIKQHIEGAAGKAWRVDLDRLRQSLGPSIDDSTVSTWVIEAPWAHPVWHSYTICLIHLRPMPGSQFQPKFHLEGATHEFSLFALSPEAPRAEIILGQVSPISHVLTPMNFGSQFIEIEDRLAIERIEKSIQEICHGKLSPDTDWQRDWIKRYNNAMIKKEYR